MKVSSISLGLAAFAVATIGHAAPEIEIGSEYQINVINTNDGLNDKDRGNQTKTTTFNLKGAKILLRGKLSDQISWNVYYKAKEGELERFYLTDKVNDSLDITIGKQKIKTYGLHRKLTSGTTTPVLGAYLDANPLKDKVAIDITYKLAGSFSLQLVDDYSKCTDNTVYTVDAASSTVKTSTGKTTSTCTSWNTGTGAGIVTNSKETQTTQKQPAVALEWYGSFGDISPLLQYAIYDLGKSSTASAGLRYKHEGLDSYVDYTLDTRKLKGNDPSDPTNVYKYIEQENKYSGLVVYAEYKVEDYTPFVHFSTFNTDPYEDGLSVPAQTTAESNAQGKLDKNESTIAVGTHYDGFGAFYRPFIDVTVASGKYVDPTDNTKKKDLSKTDLVAGLIGKF